MNTKRETSILTSSETPAATSHREGALPPIDALSPVERKRRKRIERNRRSLRTPWLPSAGHVRRAPIAPNGAYLFPHASSSLLAKSCKRRRDRKLKVELRVAVSVLGRERRGASPRGPSLESSREPLATRLTFLLSQASARARPRRRRAQDPHGERAPRPHHRRHARPAGGARPHDRVALGAEDGAVPVKTRVKLEARVHICSGKLPDRNVRRASSRIDFGANTFSKSKSSTSNRPEMVGGLRPGHHPWVRFHNKGSTDNFAVLAERSKAPV